jgi:RHS repeat-associated protein
VRQLTDPAESAGQGPSGAITLAKNYRPYGDLLSSAGSADTAYDFTGEWRDNTGLIYLRARYYEPTVGRFISRDPWQGDLFTPMSYNLWAYAYANPLRYTDPSGEFVQLILVGGVIGGVVGGVAYGLTHPSDFTVGGLLGGVTTGFIAGSVGVLAAPLAGSFAASLGFSSAGWLATGGIVGLNAFAGGLGYVTTGGNIENLVNTNLTNSCLPTWHFAWQELTTSMIFGGFGGWVGKLFPVRGMYTWKQASVFAPRTWESLFKSPTAEVVLRRATPTAAAIGFAPWLIEIINP